MSLVISYQIADIIERSRIEDVCKRQGAMVENVDCITGLDQLLVFVKPSLKLVICNLSDLVAKQDELVNVVGVSKRFGAKTLGKYPHVSKEIAAKAEDNGIDYVVPNSKFRATLERLLSR